MSSSAGVDLSSVTANRVRALDIVRVGNNQIPSIGNPGLNANPDRDIYGRSTGLNLTSGNRVSDRTHQVLESIALDNHPTPDVSTRRPDSVRNDIYDQVTQQTNYQYSIMSGQYSNRS